MSANQKHPYHLVDPSPWPLVTGFSALLMAIGFMSFGGMLTGGDEPATKSDNTAQVEGFEKPEIDEETAIKLADNTTTNEINKKW